MNFAFDALDQEVSKEKVVKKSIIRGTVDIDLPKRQKKNSVKIPRGMVDSVWRQTHSDWETSAYVDLKSRPVWDADVEGGETDAGADGEGAEEAGQVGAGADGRYTGEGGEGGEVDASADGEGAGEAGRVDAGADGEYASEGGEIDDGRYEGGHISGGEEIRGDSDVGGRQGIDVQDEEEQDIEMGDNSDRSAEQERRMIEGETNKEAGSDSMEYRDDEMVVPQTDEVGVTVQEQVLEAESVEEEEEQPRARLRRSNRRNLKDALVEKAA